MKYTSALPGIADPRLALWVHMILGGTPAYREEFIRGDTSADFGDFDDWVVRTVLNRQSPLFREARYLLRRNPTSTIVVMTAQVSGGSPQDPVAGHGHVHRLGRARELLTAKGFDTRDTTLACYSGTGFTEELGADDRSDVALIGLGELYG
ncbi:hypothetical protein [Nocardia alni]|uniref:hypothetical protein n=1 Tax=Nocardia alni TaxID=2815723 RepID=UPI001C23B2A0|nr:hypothetical protein [Nocardia alni]